MVSCFYASYSVAFFWAIARTKIPITMIRAPTQPCQGIAYPSVPKISIHTMKQQKAYVPLQPIPKAAPHIEAPLYQNLKDPDANTPLMKNIQMGGPSARACPNPIPSPPITDSKERKITPFCGNIFPVPVLPLPHYLPTHCTIAHNDLLHIHNNIYFLYKRN